MCSEQEEREAKQNDAKQTFMHDFAPTNLEYGSHGLKKKINSVSIKS